MIDALVTGAGGFIGQSLCERLRSDGHNVLAMTRANGDVSSLDTWKALPPARVLYHLAGRSFVPDSWTYGPEFMATNVVGPERALAYCREHGARLVLASAYVYGIPERLPIGEDHTVSPNNPYAQSKHLAEQLCKFAAQYQGVAATALRIFNVFGPGQRAEFLVPKILEQVREAREIRLFDLAPSRDYVFLSDVVDAFVKAANVSTGFNVINVGSGISFSVSEIVDKIQAVAGTCLPVASDSVERHQEIPVVVADIARAQQILEWRPQWSFERGIEQIFKRV